MSEKRLGFTPLHFAVERCLPRLVHYLMDGLHADVKKPTGGLGIEKEGDVSVPLITIAGLSYLARRSEDARTIFEEVCRHR